MDPITGLTRGGTPWTAQFVLELDAKKCIGCGRCYKVCPRDVFDLVEREDDMDEDLDDDNMMVMTLKNALDCIGCGSCSRVCPKDCHTHGASPITT